MPIHADIKPINALVYYTHSGGVSQAQEKIFNSQMGGNLKKEIELTLEMEDEFAGCLDRKNKVGVLIKVITDGSWQKRYGRNSLFGCGCMYGYYSGLPIYANHRCARCMKYIAWAAMSDDERPEGKGGDAPPPPHDCTRNWGAKAASNMEADIAVEGARQLLKLGVAIGVLNGLNGHNFLLADMRHWIEHLDNEKVGDPIKQLSEAGCVGIVDGMRFIKKHKSLTDLRHKKKVPKDSSKMVLGEPLGNGALYQLATTRSMEGNHLRPHRALDDAKAERDWTTNNTKLKALTTVLTQEKVVITLPQYRAYHEQYDKRSAKLKELGTHNKESS
jgi:hypothetical protein